MKPLHLSIPEVVPASVGPHAGAALRLPRPRAKWVGLHDALTLLIEAQKLAAEHAGPAEETGAVDEAGT
jgi:hypothetical protein